MIKAVVFDLDDTLISEMDFVRSGYRHVANIVAKKYSQKQESVYDDLFRLFNENSKYIFNRYFEKNNIEYTECDILQLANEYRGHLPNISFLPDVLPFLDKLRDNKIKTGIITDGFAVSQRNKLKALGDEEYFDKIIVTDELGKEYWKPSPKPFEIIRNYFKIEYNEMVYIGDNPAKDFYIKNIYPIYTVRICRNESIHSKNDYMEGVTEDFRVFKFDEIDIFRL